MAQFFRPREFRLQYMLEGTYDIVGVLSELEDNSRTGSSRFQVYREGIPSFLVVPRLSHLSRRGRGWPQPCSRRVTVEGAEAAFSSEEMCCVCVFPRQDRIISTASIIFRVRIYHQRSDVRR